MNHKIIVNIQINHGNFRSFAGQWQKFAAAECEKPDISVSVSARLTHKYGVDILPDQPGPAVLKCRNALVSANDDWTQACVTLLDGRDEGLEGALIAVIMTHLSTRGGLMLHASLIDVRGRGILFVGPSGIGKTTQAELWQYYRDAVIINGDMALVHEADGVFCGHGCPWHGSSVYCENRQAPLSGIVVLEQAKENSVEQLSGIALAEQVMRNVFLPHWYPAGVEAAMETLNHLLDAVPVYLLKCRPDESAVEIADGVLFHA